MHQATLDAAFAASGHRRRHLKDTLGGQNLWDGNAVLNISEPRTHVEAWVTQHPLMAGPFFTTDLQAAQQGQDANAWQTTNLLSVELLVGTGLAASHLELHQQQQHSEQVGKTVQHRSMQTTTNPPPSFPYAFQTYAAGDGNYSNITSSSTPLDQTAASLSLFAALIQDLARSMDDLEVSQQSCIQRWTH